MAFDIRWHAVVVPSPAPVHRSLLVGSVGALVASGALAAVDVRHVAGPVFALATVAGSIAVAAAAAARLLERQGTRPLVAVAVSGAAALCGSGAIVDFTGPGRLQWLWAGVAIGALLTCGWAAVEALRSAPVAKPTDEAPFADEPPEDIDPQTVAAGLENVRWVLADEQARGQSLQTRASGLAGFAGIIISLLAAAASGVADRDDLSAGQQTAVTTFLTCGLALLVGAIAMLLLGVLATRQIHVTALRELELYKTRRYMSHTVQWAHGRITTTLVGALAAERLQNSRRVRWLNAGAAAIVAALVFVAAGALTLLL
jgi:hypothetical protein